MWGIVGTWVFNRTIEGKVIQLWNRIQSPVEGDLFEHSVASGLSFCDEKLLPQISELWEFSPIKGFSCEYTGGLSSKEFNEHHKEGVQPTRILWCRHISQPTANPYMKPHNVTRSWLLSPCHCCLIIGNMTIAPSEIFCIILYSRKYSCILNWFSQ